MDVDVIGDDPALNVRFARVSIDTIDVDTCARAVADARCGAVVTFDGAVRNHDEGRSVRALHYSAHPSAAEVILDVAIDIAAAHPDVLIAVAHRVGALQVGDCALACAVSSPHRSEAFEACAALVDRVKERVPIWKEQFYEDGDVGWVNSIG